MLLQNKQVAIVGGGPGGLTLARLLQLKGANVKLYERDVNKDARVQGSPLDMHEGSGYEALRKAGLIDVFNKNIRVGADKKIIVNECAEIFFSDHENTSANTTNNVARPEIDRGVLRQILLESLQPETVIWNSHFIMMEKQNEGWLLHFKNGSTAYADVVIAADGVNSKIRPYITNIKALFSNITMVEVNVYDAKNSAPHLYKLSNGGKVMAFGKSKCILGGQKGNADIGFYLSLPTTEDWLTTNGLNYDDTTQLLAWFKQAYEGWGDVWYELIENAATPLIPRPIYYMPLDQEWQALSNLTMLGDAAHVMPPFAGEGANMSMLDALELSENLTGNTFNNLHDAIAGYEINMRKRASAATKQSLENGERMHSENALQTMLKVFGIS